MVYKNSILYEFLKSHYKFFHNLNGIFYDTERKIYKVKIFNNENRSFYLITNATNDYELTKQLLDLRIIGNE